MFKSVLTTFLLASYLPAVLADKCSAVGWQSDQSVVKYGFQGVQMGVKLYRGDDLIGDYKPCSKCQTACTDYVDVKGDGLEEPFGWAASCNINHFTECHGSYASQTHIKGEKPSQDSDFYGIGITHSSQCKIEFDC